MITVPDLSPLVLAPWAVVSGPTVSGYDYGIIAVYLVFLASMGWIFRRFTRGSKD